MQIEASIKYTLMFLEYTLWDLTHIQRIYNVSIFVCFLTILSQKIKENTRLVIVECSIETQMTEDREKTTEGDINQAQCMSVI